LHKSSTPLALGFRAVFLMSSTRCGISAKQLERETGVTYKTAWRRFKQIRMLLQPDAGEPPLSGEVEVDETFYGGKPRVSDGIKDRQDGKKWADANKRVIFGMVERGGRVRAIVVPDRTKATLIPHMRSFVMPPSMIYPDEHHPYTAVSAAGSPATGA
jgi:transposase